jgi:hypothetical protein
MASPIATSFGWRGPRRKRFLLVMAVISLLYLFFKNLPKDAITATRRQGSRFLPPGSQLQTPSGSKGAPPRSDGAVDCRHYFAGPIKYHKLAASLYSDLGPVHDNRNVLFVVSNLQSAARLLPLACDMSKQNKNRVHLMLTGRDDNEKEDIEKINGVTEADCSIKWHDARPDFSIYSTDYRMERSVRASLGHIAPFMRPRVVLIDSPEREDTFLTKGMKEKTRELRLPLIELPINAAENLKWVSKLDGSSLKAWNEIGLEILIHAPPESSGSLIRLLRSLESADYFGFPLPRLTIELPNNIDPPTRQYLSNLQWPRNSRMGSSKLTLRHRLLSGHVNALQSSIRQIESFFPVNAPHSHILILSPQVELSPLYFHYLIYTLLEYKYSNAALHNADGLVGISLERPPISLTGKGSLSTPDEASSKALFLHQAPDSNAALYFGDKWIELHSFLSNRFAVDKAPTGASDTQSSVLGKAPSWLSYILELSRARGYTMLYPSFASREDSLATIHTELFQPPQEYTDRTSISSASAFPAQETSLTDSTEVKAMRSADELQLVTMSRSILHLLNPSLPATDSGGPLPDLSTLPVLSHTGELLPQGQVSLNQAAITYADTFAKEFGGCAAAEGEGQKSMLTRPARKPWSADDLFCVEEAVKERNLGIGDVPRIAVDEAGGMADSTSDYAGKTAHAAAGSGGGSAPVDVGNLG